MVLAAAVTFGVAPLVNRMASGTTSVIRLSSDVKQGRQITDAQIKTVKVNADTLPAGVITQKSAVVGKYASSNLYAGEYLTSVISSTLMIFAVTFLLKLTPGADFG